MSASNTLEMTDGTLKFGQLSLYGVVDIYGGTVPQYTRLKNYGTLNIHGNDSVWEQSYHLEGNGTLNFIAGEFDGTAKMFSTLNNKSGSMTFSGTISVDMGNYFNGDLIYVTGSLDQTLISASSIGDQFTIESNLKDCMLLKDWNVQQIGNDLVLTFDGPITEVDTSTSTSVTGFGEEGWLKLTGTPTEEPITLTMEYTGLGSAEDFVRWLNESMGETQGSVNVSWNENSIVFSDLLLDNNGIGHLYLDYSAYNSYHREAFPEPATWAMLIIGLTVSSFFRKRKGR